MPIKTRTPTGEELRRIHQRFKTLSNIPEAEFAIFAKNIAVKEFDKGETFAKIGDHTRNAAFVLSGGFQIAYTTDNGKLITRNFCCAGSFMASYATILTGRPVHVEIKAFEPSSAAVIDFAVLEEAYDRHPSWERLGRRLAENHYIDREEREFQLLTKSAVERYKEFLRIFPGLINRVTQATVASYIGVTPVALSRILNQKMMD